MKSREILRILSMFILLSLLSLMITVPVFADNGEVYNLGAVSSNMTFFYTSIIAAVILYVNTISILKKIKKEESTWFNTIIGSICIIVTLVSIFIFFVR